jgi:hypothetical protein
MKSAAILVGNTEYRNLANLECCHDDLLAVKQLLDATEKYEIITTIENTEADELKSQLRSAIDKIKSPTELFFYFTGHGYQHEAEFFHCATNFDSRRPNQTGLSTEELHKLLRLSEGELVVKVIDACHSGTLLLKSDGGWLPQNKDGFKNLIQIASCLDSQSSLTGNPLSAFTEKFRAATLRKSEGPIFYTDIINFLRDEFIDNDAQTPFFVSQHTAREQFVDDAAKLDHLRKAFLHITNRSSVDPSATQHDVAPALTLLDRLRAADAKVVKQDRLERFVGDFFESLIKAVSASEFAEFFDLNVIEHDDFREPTAQEFIILSLSKEPRADNFVTATHTRRLRGGSAWSGAAALLQSAFPNELYDETWNLKLNCTMSKVQLRITLAPKFVNLRLVTLVVTCAPSLDYCYIFEITTQHKLRDFNKFDSEGVESSKRWWKVKWHEAPDGIIRQIAIKFTEIVQGQLEAAEKRLSPDPATPARL